MSSDTITYQKTGPFWVHFFKSLAHFLIHNLQNDKTEHKQLISGISVSSHPVFRRNLASFGAQSTK